jgi:F420-dependent methylenetetrahydromethanopterin dehydrogenase
MTAAHNPMIDPTEMSISPVTMIKVIAKATMAAGMKAAIAMEMFDAVKKYSDIAVPNTKVATRKARRSASQRAK